MRLQLENGQIKAYDTWYTTVGGESGLEIYETKCGIRLYKRPESSEEYGHIDCAIGVLDQGVAGDKFAALMLIAGGVFGFFASSGSGDQSFASIFGIIAITISLFFYAKSSISSRARQELIEFRDYGTINGIEAWKL